MKIYLIIWSVLLSQFDRKPIECETPDHSSIEVPANSSDFDIMSAMVSAGINYQQEHEFCVVTCVERVMDLSSEICSFKGEYETCLQCPSNSHCTVGDRI